nr:immunoglobulin heavy chain junction region [Macaca mulatta]MOV47834.1 immunoglobulin heavy chain junction region [Macaca mulatta]MOV48686.1 immunoglobulin heavy chain junction region [Macaca mulatta]
CARIQSYFDFW